MKLYKYLSLGKGRQRASVKRIFTERRLRFAKPLDFNDPFDCKTLFHFDTATDNDWRTFLTEAEKALNPQEDKVIHSIVEHKLALGLHRHAEFQREQLRKHNEVLRESISDLGMLCLSALNDDILMWSHYADGHRGICLEFDKDQLEKQYYLAEVTYRDRYPEFGEFVRLAKNNEMHMVLWTKATHWRYEQEWRAIVNVINNDPHSQHLPGMITGVILGCEMPDPDSALVKS